MEGCADVSRAGFDSRPWHQGGLCPWACPLLPPVFPRRGIGAGPGRVTESHPPGYMLSDMAFGRACQTGAGFKSPAQPNREMWLKKE